MKKIILATFLFLIAGCSSDDGGFLDLFIPNISNQWESDRDSKFFFNPENTGVSESNFIGSEQTANADENGETFFEFTGRFKNYDIEFTFTNGTEKGIKYTGHFIKGSNPLRIEVTGTNKKKVKIVQILTKE